MPSYLTLPAYRSRTTIPSELVDSCAERGKDPQLWLDDHSSWIRGRLAKRYAVDFSDPGPVPGIILLWLKRLVDIEVWQAIGTNPEGRLDGSYEAEAQKVKDEVREAADAKDGLFELPLRNTDPLGASAVSKGAPLAYSEASPYAWTTLQADAARRGGGA